MITLCEWLDSPSSFNLEMLTIIPSMTGFHGRSPDRSETPGIPQPPPDQTPPSDPIVPPTRAQMART
jgi:hypothetical protein